jgi:hypothetical protein
MVIAWRTLRQVLTGRNWPRKRFFFILAETKKHFTMKHLLIIFMQCLLLTTIVAQAPQAFKYQALVRDNSGEIIQNQAVGIRVSIHDASAGGTIIYQETFTGTTNQFGLVNLEIGQGTPTVGAFSLIDWGANAKFLEMEIDPAGGVNYISMGTSALLSVPYALYSDRSSDALWSKNNLDIYYNDGRVGIGTDNPQELLELYGNNSTTGFRASWGNTYDGLYGDFRHAGSGGLQINSQTPSGTGGWADISFMTNGTTKMFLESGGNVGIGTISPTNLLELSSTAPKLYFNREASTTNLSGIYWRSTADNFEGALVRNNNTGSFEWYTDISGSTPRMAVTNSGNVGIGLAAPEVLLEISTSTQFYPGDFQDLRKGSILLSQVGGITGNGFYSCGIAFSGINTSRRRAAIAAIQTNTDVDQVGLAFFTHPGTAATNDEVVKQMVITHDGNVGIGTPIPSSRLDVVGNVTIRDITTESIAVQLGTGLDYAEGFDVSDEEIIEPGTLLCIDPENAGKLKVSDQPYDRKVAGIVAGANGLGSGVRLGTMDFDCNVALAGRVYCKTLATDEDIHPGDLLTTSSVPGYAMKVTDHAKAQGAIVGKAMESLPKGEKGQILVLVTLQ